MLLRTLVALTLLALTANAQSIPMRVVKTNVAPSGSCLADVIYQVGTVLYACPSGAWVTISGGGEGGGPSAWGSITGTLSAQTDLQAQLDGKQESLGFTPPPNTRSIATAARLAGGGNLTADRTLDLASGVVTPGTYPKVTVDTYGRVTTGAALVAGDIPSLPAYEPALGFTAVPTTRTITAGAGLTGGGDLSANRTISPDIATQGEAQAGTVNNKLMTPLRTAEAIAALGGGGGGTQVETVRYRAAKCQNTVPGMVFNYGASGAPAAICVTGANTSYATLQFTADTQAVQDAFQLPVTFTSMTAVITSRTAGTTGNMVWSLEGVCVGNGEAAGNVGAGGPSFATAQTITNAATGTAYQNVVSSPLTVTVTGCAAYEDYMFKLSRGTSTATNPELLGIIFSITK